LGTAKAEFGEVQGKPYLSVVGGDKGTRTEHAPSVLRFLGLFSKVSTIESWEEETWRKTLQRIVSYVNAYVTQCPAPVLSGIDISMQIPPSKSERQMS